MPPGSVRCPRGLCWWLIALACLVQTARARAETTAPAAHAGSQPGDVKYLLERIEVVGSRRTKASLVKQFVPLQIGSTFAVDDPEIEAFRYRLLGTGWYDRVELRLERGQKPGWVVLVIDLEERRTLVFQRLAAGVGWSVDPSSRTNREPNREPEPYLGLSVAESNFLGTGKTVSGEVLVARNQGGFALGYQGPVVRSSRWGLHSLLTFAKGHEYFGGDDPVDVSVQCPVEQDPEDPCQADPPVAVVEYFRIGLSLGTSRDIGAFTRVSLNYRGDLVGVLQGGMPSAASEQRGELPAPIDFSIEPGWSYSSLLNVDFTYDRRDSAILPSRGLLANFGGDLASILIGSDYDFVRLQASVQRWFSLSWGHTIRLGAFTGAVFGRAPFFYKFFVSDLTDLQPSRILGLNLDHRPAPNLFGVLSCGKPFGHQCGTAVSEMGQEELAARVDVEYAWPFVRGRKKFLKAADAFFLVGLYGLADPGDLKVAVPGYEGLSRLPIDLTLDAGVRLDTQIGVFQIGLAKLMWLPVGAL